MSGIYDLYRQIGELGNLPAEYVAKMNHKVPESVIFNREEYLIKASRNKVIMDIGASGPMAAELKKVAKVYHGVDLRKGPTVDTVLDLDKATALPDVPGLQIIVAGEVIEHVHNAGHFLDLLRATGKQVILTTPNAHSLAGWEHMKRGIEHVNIEHVCYYSYWTLKRLVEQHGFRVLIWGWYNGKPLTAEGLIFHMEPTNDGTD